jgi:hypothetical protein
MNRDQIKIRKKKKSPLFSSKYSVGVPHIVCKLKVILKIWANSKAQNFQNNFL